jgi:hypothetical protein
LRSSR